MDVAIIGHKGFIGSALWQALERDTPYTLHGWDRRDKPHQNLQQVTDANFHAEVVVNVAGTTNRSACESDPIGCFGDNVVGVYKVVSRWPRAHHIFMSTSLVYGQVPYGYSSKEDLPLNPTCVYGHSKLCAEGILRTLTKNHTIFRGFNVWGRGMSKEHFLPALKECKERNSPITIGRDASGAMISRDYVHIDVLVDKMVQAIDRNIKGTFNVGSGTPTFLEDLASAQGVRITNYLLPPHEVTHTLADMTKTKEHFLNRPSLSNLEDYFK